MKNIKFLQTALIASLAVFVISCAPQRTLADDDYIDQGRHQRVIYADPGMMGMGNMILVQDRFTGRLFYMDPMMMGMGGGMMMGHPGMWHGPRGGVVRQAPRQNEQQRVQSRQQLNQSRQSVLGGNRRN